MEKENGKREIRRARPEEETVSGKGKRKTRKRPEEERKTRR